MHQSNLPVSCISFVC